MSNNYFFNMKEFDKSFGISSFKLCGIDEAGRGPLMGPVVAASVILPDDIQIVGLNDSKKISETKRYLIEEEIKEKSLAWGIGFVHANEIDKIGIQEANFLAFKISLENMISKFNINPELVLIDGNYKNIPIKNHKTIIKGDSLSAVISAASILAKTARDRYVLEICHNKYPYFSFDKNKGYGTKTHREAIIKYGLTEFHRKFFCHNILKDKDLTEGGVN